MTEATMNSFAHTIVADSRCNGSVHSPVATKTFEDPRQPMLADIFLRGSARCALLKSARNGLHPSPLSNIQTPDDIVSPPELALSGELSSNTSPQSTPETAMTDSTANGSAIPEAIPTSLRNKHLENVVAHTPGRQPSPQPTHLSVPGSAHSSRVVAETGPGYVAPSFEGKAQQMEQGAFFQLTLLLFRSMH